MNLDGVCSGGSVGSKDEAGRRGYRSPHGKWQFFGGGLSLIGLNGILSVFLKHKCIPLVREKINNISVWIINISTESLLNAVFKMYFVTRSRLAFTRNLLKCNIDFRKKLRVTAILQRVG